jgi:hypothetical protein
MNLEANPLVVRLRARAILCGEEFSDIENVWLEREHSPEGPPILGDSRDQERYEKKVIEISRLEHGITKLRGKREVSKFLKEIQRAERSGSYAGTLAAIGLKDVDEPFMLDAFRFGVTALGQAMQILGLIVVLFVVLIFAVRC